MRNDRKEREEDKALPLWFLSILFLVALFACIGIYIATGLNDGTLPAPPNETQKNASEEERGGLEVVKAFHFNERSGLLGWNRNKDVLEVSNTVQGLSLKVAPHANPRLFLDRPIDATTVSAVRVRMSNGFPSVRWKPSKPASGANLFRIPDLIIKEDQLRTTYYFFVEDEPAWNGQLAVTLCPDHFSVGPKGKEIFIRSISFLRISQEFRRFLEEKGGERGREKIGFEVREVIYANPPHRFEQRFTISGRMVLEFGYGILNSCWNKPGDGVLFSVFLREDAGNDRLLLRKEANPKMNEGDRRWFDVRIPLDEYEGRKATFVFETDPGKDHQYDYAVWTPPQVFSLLRNPEDINVLLVSLDTLRADHLRCYGYSRDTSPAMDALAAEGVLFTSAFAPSSSTLTSHMSLMTSVLPNFHQVLNETDVLGKGTPTLAEALQEKGYFTAAFTENTYVASKFGFERGFYRYHDGFQPFSNLGTKEIQKTFPAASDWIRNNAFKKFFLFLHTYETHIPYAPPPPFNRKFWGVYKGSLGEEFRFPLRQKILKGEIQLLEEDLAHVVDLYDGAICHADQHLAGVIKVLRETNLLDKTLIILLSDHGEDFYDHFLFAEHGTYLYDELIRVPLILRLPKLLPSGMRVSGLASLMDVMPTVMEILGIPSKEISHGRSLLPLIRGEESHSRVYSMINIHWSPMERFSVRTDQYKYIYTPHCDAISGKEKLLSLPHAAGFKGLLSTEELFDMRADPKERQNIAGENPELANQFKETLEKLILQFKRRYTKKKIGIQKELRQRLEALGYIQ